MDPVVTESQFYDMYRLKLGKSWVKALELFRKYSRNCSFDFANVLWHAAEQGKVEEVLGILEEHFNEHLAHQHPDSRGLVEDRLLGVNKTSAMFLRICQDTLGLEPGETLELSGS